METQAEAFTPGLTGSSVVRRKFAVERGRAAGEDRIRGLACFVRFATLGLLHDERPLYSALALSQRRGSPRNSNLDELLEGGVGRKEMLWARSSKIGSDSC